MKVAELIRQLRVAPQSLPVRVITATEASPEAWDFKIANVQIETTKGLPTELVIYIEEN